MVYFLIINSTCLEYSECLLMFVENIPKLEFPR